jgi:hypothetical protein
VRAAKAVCPAGYIDWHIEEQFPLPWPPLALHASLQSRYARQSLPVPHAATCVEQVWSTHALHVDGASIAASFAGGPESEDFLLEASGGGIAVASDLPASGAGSAAVIPASSSDAAPDASSPELVLTFIPESVASRPCVSSPQASGPASKSSRAVTVVAPIDRIKGAW